MKDAKISGDGRACSLCEIFKSWDQFDKKSTGVNGRHSHCKACVKLEKKKWWRRKNKKMSTSPQVLIPSEASLESVPCALTIQDRRDLENIFRRLVYQSVISGKEKKS